MTFSILDVFVVLAYLGGIALFGIWTGGHQASARDYFLSERRVPWWAVCFAIVATETSALTFLSIPGLAYAGNFTFLQIAFGYLLGRIIVAWLLLPRYFQGELSTAYAFLERRFGSRLRRSASGVFMGTRIFADGVRLYTTAIPLALLFRGWGAPGALPENMLYVAAITILSALTLVYVFSGGVRAVIWTDTVQLVIYIAGAVAAIALLSRDIPGGLSGGFAQLEATGKLRIINVGFGGGLSGLIRTPYTTVAGVLGGMFLSMASHGTDQLIIQRVLATNDLKRSRWAMVLSGVIVIMQFALFLVLGSLLFLAYGGQALSPNEVFARYIIERIPSGLSGLIVAGILAAAMSTLSGSISALSSASMLDFIIPLSRASWSEDKKLRWSRAISLGWCFLLVLVALLFIRTPSTVIELALGIASYTYGGLLGVFLLGILSRRATERDALTGFAAGIAVMTVVILATPVAWTWYTFIGTAACLAAAAASRHLFPSTSSAG